MKSHQNMFSKTFIYMGDLNFPYTTDRINLVIVMFRLSDGCWGSFSIFTINLASINNSFKMDTNQTIEEVMKCLDIVKYQILRISMVKFTAIRIIP